MDKIDLDKKKLDTNVVENNLPVRQSGTETTELSRVNKKKESTEVELNKEFLDNHLITLDKEYELLLNRMNQKRKDQFKNT